MPRPRRPDPTASASCAVMPRRDEVGDEPGDGAARPRSAAAPLTEMRKVIVRPPARLRHGVEQLVPRDDELLDALVLEQLR